MSQSADPQLDALRVALAEPLRAALGEGCDAARLERLEPPKTVADDTAKLVMPRRPGHAPVVVLVAGRVAPELVGRGVERAREAKGALGPRLGRVVLDPLASGRVEGRSFAVYPFRTPLARSRILFRVQRATLLPGVLAWLREATEATVGDARPDEAEREFAAPLDHLARRGDLPDEVRAKARRALLGLRSGAWQPRCVVAHNDLWHGNVLLDGDVASLARVRPRGFVLVDWPASSTRGHAFFDLVRCAISFRLGPERLAREVVAHRRILGCSAEEAFGYLLAALGSIGLRLEHMPPSLYQRMARSSLDTLAEVVGAPA